MTIDPKADARLALDVLATEDAYDAAGGPGKAPLDIPLEPRLAPLWALRGHIVGTDAVLQRGVGLALGAQAVWYGYVLQSLTDPVRFACLIRGTSGAVEWWDDAKCAQVRYPRGGNVEDGFWKIAESLTYRRPGGPNVPLVAALSGIVGSGSLLIAGHSLGATLAIYRAADLADPSRLGKRLSLRAYASPHPGDALFAQYAGSLIADYRCYARELDIVPRLPEGFGYSCLPTTVLPWNANGVRVRIESGARGQHHVLSYAAQLDPSCITPAALLPIDKPYLDCLIFPPIKAAA
ncbi:MAG: lipase family protein [Steroidobacteraceae bacterium]